MQVDIAISGHGVYSIIGLTEAGQQFLAQNVDSDDASSGYAMSDDQRYTEDIAEGATEDGLTVVVNSHLYLSGGGRGEAV